MVTNFLSPYEPNAKMTTQSQPDPLLLNLDSAGGGVAANLLMQQRLAVLQTRQIGGSSDEASSSHEGEEEENDSDRGESPANGPTIKMDWSPSQGPNGTGLAPPMANGAQISPAGTNGSGRSSDGGGGTDGCNATDAEGVWSADIETAFQEALAIYPPCGRRKIILSDEGKMYGRNELIARYIKIRTGKTRTRKQVSSHIQVLARKRTRELQSKLKKGSSSGFFQDQTVKEKALQTLNGMSSAQIVSASAMHNRAVTQTLGNLYGVNTNTLGFSPPPNPFGNFGNDLDIKPSFAAQIANAMAAGYNMGQRQPSSTPGANYPPANPASLPPHNAPPAWEGRTISTPKIRLCDFSAYLEPSQRENTTEASSLRHELVRIGGNVTHVDHLLEAIDISQIYDKFPDKKGGLKDLFEKGPQNAFFLVKFWADITFNVPEEQNAFYAVDSRYESNEAMTIMVSTKVCSFGKQVVEKVETEYSHFNNGRFVFRIDRSPMCEYMINFVHKLKQLPEKYMMNSVLENFTILQVVINRETQETLLCIAFVFEVSDGDGSQHHVYKLVREGK